VIEIAAPQETHAMTTEKLAVPRIGKVTLTVHDLALVGQFYQDVIGLRLLGSDGEAMLLGAGDAPVIELRRDAAARRHSRRDAGLFHTAFLLPARGHLAQWLSHFAETGGRLQGASDHLVSEAVYLSDPEGNGIEIYVDRARDEWRWTNGEVAMTTDALDLEALMATQDDVPAWDGFPDGGTIGHVHLQVGDIPNAEAFYAGVLGQDITTHYPGATFYSWGGYHHHIATNIWNSRNASPRQEPATGLADVEILMPGADMIAAVRGRAEKAQAAMEEAGSGLRLRDPWRSAISLRQAAA
jgi:catechol 2,3-dioxygenase